MISRRKHKKLFELTKGYRMTKNRLVQVAKEASLHAGNYAFAGRKLKKRDMRQLWIVRISQALKKLDWSYSRFLATLKKEKVILNRKILAHLVTEHPEVFEKIVKNIK